MSQEGQPWRQNWEPYPKHRRATERDFENGRAAAFSRHPGHAQYDPRRYGTDDAVRDAELQCIRAGIRLYASEHLRTFYLRMADNVGVCCGQLTPYLFVEWHIGGMIHGRPMCEADLKRKGASL